MDVIHDPQLNKGTCTAEQLAPSCCKFEMVQIVKERKKSTKFKTALYLDDAANTTQDWLLLPYCKADDAANTIQDWLLLLYRKAAGLQWTLMLNTPSLPEPFLHKEHRDTAQQHWGYCLWYRD